MRKSTRTNQIFKASLLAVGFFALASNQAMAQNIGTAIDAARTSVSGIQTNVGNLILAIGGIVGLAGAIRVYVKWQNGDQDVQKHLIGWLAASIFLVLAGTIVSGFFG